MTAPWAENKNSLLHSLGTSKENGLSSSQAKLLQEKIGKNVLTTTQTIKSLSLYLRQLKNPMVYTLVLASLVAFYIQEKLNALAILSIIVINSVIGFFQEYKAEKAIRSLKKLTVPQTRVIRDGNVQTIAAEDVIPGDILQLEAGDYVVADARVLEAFQLSADESILTGESFPTKKNSQEIDERVSMADRKNMLYAGTAISTGSGKAVVTSIGMETELGHIAQLLNTREEQATPLQERLEKVGQKLLIVGFLVILAVFVSGWMEGQDWFAILMIGISLAVAAIPEGLPTIVTLALTLAVRRMTKRHALVRKLGAVETLGSTDIICSDKTGTLTSGKMKVREVVNQSGECFREHDFRGSPDFFRALVLCNNASLHQGGSGDPTEIALLKMAKGHGVDIKKMRLLNSRLHEWSFESTRKRMTVAVDNGNEISLYCKGAPEALLPLCQLSSSEREKLEQLTHELSGRGRRTLAVAMKNSIDKNISGKVHHEVEQDLRFLALVSLADPPKEETISSITQCKAAGIKVIMITGDHPATAGAIANELGITETNFNEVLTGEELDGISSQELRKRAEHTAVYARVSPEHKLKIIEALKQNGHVVSMTGDGVNDAPALKMASIGVAMGKGGTEVARQAASIVLTDDNFSTIVSAVEEGRAIYGNIKRTIQYLLSTNLAEIMIVLGCSILALPAPLTPISLLWINLVTDGFPSLALAAEPVEKNFLQQSDGPSPSSFFDREFMRELSYVAFLITLVNLVVYYYSIKKMDVESAKTFSFTLLVYMTLFRSFSCRSEKKTFVELPLNIWHLASVLGPVIIQLFLQHVPLFQRLFQIRALTVYENFILFMISLVPVTIVEIWKVRRRFDHFRE